MYIDYFLQIKKQALLSGVAGKSVLFIFKLKKKIIPLDQHE